MKRVVVTGMGIVSSLGNNVGEVTQSLKEGKSGIQFCEDYAELGMRSHVAGRVSIDYSELIDRKNYVLWEMRRHTAMLQCSKRLKTRV